jgi:hypothetical protein
MQHEADPAAALDAATEGIRLARTSLDKLTEVRGLWAKGHALCRLGRPAEAFSVGEEALRAARTCDWPNGDRLARFVISRSAMGIGRFERTLEETSN